MKNWAIFVGGVLHSRYKQRSDADGHAAFLRQTTPGKRVEVVWDVEISPAERMAIVGTVLLLTIWTVAIANRPASAYEDDGYGYNQRGLITLAAADAMQNYAPGQSYHAIKSRLGYPTYRRGAADIYEIAHTGDRGGQWDHYLDPRLHGGRRGILDEVPDRGDASGSGGCAIRPNGNKGSTPRVFKE